MSLGRQVSRTTGPFNDNIASLGTGLLVMANTAGDGRSVTYLVRWPSRFIGNAAVHMKQP